MRGLSISLAALVTGCAIATSALANGLTAEQKTRLDASLSAFHKATEANDAMAVVGFMPPAMIRKLALAANASEAAFRETLAAKLSALAKSVNKAEFAVDVTQANEGTVADGTPYAIVPTKMKLELKNGTNVKIGGKTFAFEQGGQWYLLALNDEATQHDFYEAYPQFKGVDISPSRPKTQGN